MIDITSNGYIVYRDLKFISGMFIYTNCVGF